MKRTFSMKYVITSVLFSAACFTASAQFLPPDDGIPPTPPGWENGIWVGDTVIVHPIPNLRGPFLSLDSTPRIIAISGIDAMKIASEAHVHFSYEIIDGNSNIMMHSVAVANPLFSFYINTSSLPIGRYTLLLYINNECLEGEFEKED